VRRVGRLLGVVTIALGILLAVPAVASAHPLGNFTINLYSGLIVEPDRLQVQYVLDMAEIPTFQQRGAMDVDGDGRIDASDRSAYAAREATRLLDGVRASTREGTVRLRLISSAMRFRQGQAGWSTPITRLTAVFEGPIGSSGVLRYRDDNFPGHIGWREVTAVGAEGAALSSSSVPSRSVSDTLLHYPTALLSTPLHVTSATAGFRPGASGAPPVLPTGGAVSGSRILVSGGGFAKLATWTRLSIPVALVAMLLALAFGAGHALLPGHGKTIMAGYLVGAGGRRIQAVQVGVAVAFMHTASVVAIGLVVLYLTRFASEQLYPLITLGSGLLVAAMGLTLFASRARAARRGNPAWHGHDHDDGAEHHSHDHGPDAHERPLSRRSLTGLAVAGGVLPSPTALVVLLSTVGTHRVVFGISLIVAFSVGLAGALVGVGLLALRARAVVARRLRGRAGSLLPLLSAMVVVGVGVFLVTRGATQI
jgi:nickel/cobalt transporter (NicO) family protein